MSRQTKIVATIGPASREPEMLARLLAAGVDVFRLNLSHGRPEEHRVVLDHLRRLEAEAGRPIGVIADLQGLKLRIGTFRGGAITLSAGQRLRFDADPTPGDGSRVPVPHPELFAVLDPGATLLLDDGKVRLRVVETAADHVMAEVVAGMRLSDNKGLHAPGVLLPYSALTERDREHLRFALEAGCDWVALSFVQRPEDVVEARRIVGARAGIIVKIENPPAVAALDRLIELADAVMVARGDLGVEIPSEQVPGLQKRIVAAARAAGKPVGISGQMLESMVEDPVPTRAEASDVATAVFDGADALMLSGETASGRFPVDAVATMDRIIRAIESDPSYREILPAPPPPRDLAPDAVIAAAHLTARTIGAAFLATFSTAGKSALRAARQRPEMPVLALCASLSAARRLGLSYGVQPAHLPNLASEKDIIRAASRLAVERGLARNGDACVLTAGLPVGAAGTTNMMRVAWVDDGEP
ncbi:MAG: pyruvate kinase [Rhodospirillales bacterium]|nr:pyruvate kinase [Rhodospirillales bacterium]